MSTIKIVLSWLITQSTLASILSSWLHTSTGVNISNGCHLYSYHELNIMGHVCGAPLTTFIDHINIIRILIIFSIMLSTVLFFVTSLVSEERLIVFRKVLSVILIGTCGAASLIWFEVDKGELGVMEFGDGVIFSIMGVVLSTMYLLFSTIQCDR